MRMTHLYLVLINTTGPWQTFNLLLSFSEQLYRVISTNSVHVGYMYASLYHISCEVLKQNALVRGTYHVRHLYIYISISIYRIT